MKRQALLLAAAGIAATISGCGDYDPAHLAAMNTKLASLDSRVTALEKAPPPAPSVPTVLWVQEGGYPRASAYFTSKEECATQAAGWGFPDDKTAKLVNVDPWITRSGKNDQFGRPITLTVTCLPQGVAPFTK